MTATPPSTVLTDDLTGGRTDARNDDDLDMRSDAHPDQGRAGLDDPATPHDIDAELDPHLDAELDSQLESELDEQYEDERSSEALFDGDDGRLDLAQRQALVAIVKKRFISAVADPRVWKTLVEHQQILRSRLNDLFMDLHLDLEREVAFKRQVSPEGGGSFPTLLYDTPWGREDTILLVHLRSRMRNEQAAGNSRVFIDRSDMLDAIESHRPTSATDQAADRRRAIKAIETLYKAGLLIGPSTGDRFEVSAAIEVILPVEKLRELLAWLRAEDGTSDNTEDRIAAAGATRAVDPAPRVDLDAASDTVPAPPEADPAATPDPSQEQ